MRMKRCLACGSKNLNLVLDLGKQPLANNYGETKKYPLATNACYECGHMQLTHSVSPKKLYSHYLYESGTSETLRKWFEKFATKLGTHNQILDIASNDGTFLRICKDRGNLVQGIDPAANLTPKDVSTVVGFFDKSTRLGRFDYITAFNVLAHTPDPLSILEGIRANLKPSGRAFIMTSQAEQLPRGQFDTIYHEHHSYFTYTSIHTLLLRAGFRVVDITLEPIHGGSMLVEVAPVDVAGAYKEFSWQASEIIKQAREFEPKHRMVAVGAAAKGVVFLNTTGLKPEVVADEASIKWGYKVPGTEIPIVSLKELASYDEPLTIIYLAWNFYDELVKKVKKVRPRRRDQHIRFFQ